MGVVQLAWFCTPHTQRSMGPIAKQVVKYSARQLEPVCKYFLVHRLQPRRDWLL